MCTVFLTITIPLSPQQSLLLPTTSIIQGIIVSIYYAAHTSNLTSNLIEEKHDAWKELVGNSRGYKGGVDGKRGSFGSYLEIGIDDDISAFSIESADEEAA